LLVPVKEDACLLLELFLDTQMKEKI
jgi:hypothetical protein